MTQLHDRIPHQLSDHAGFQPFPAGLFVLVVLWPLLTPYRRIAPQRFGLLFGSCSSCLCFASGFLPTPHYCDAVAFGYLIPPCQRLIGDFHPSYVSCLTYKKTGGIPRTRQGIPIMARYILLRKPRARLSAHQTESYRRAKCSQQNRIRTSYHSAGQIRSVHTDIITPAVVIGPTLHVLSISATESQVQIGRSIAHATHHQGGPKGAGL